MIEINTKEIVEKWQEEIKERINKLNFKPALNIIQIGDKEESNIYVRNKMKTGEKLGIEVNIIKHDKASQKVIECDLEMAYCPTILQLPVEGINVNKAMRYLSGLYDVDGFTIFQKGLLADGDHRALIPATALGVLRILKETAGSLSGKKVVIVNRSHLIGKPLMQLMLNENAYVTVCHSKTPTDELKREMKEADIVITGCGLRKVFDSSYFKDGQILIDCSMAKVEGIKGVGDMDKEDILKKLNVKIASGFGHTGIATVTALFDNVIKFYELETEF